MPALVIDSFIVRQRLRTLTTRQGWAKLGWAGTATGIRTRCFVIGEHAGAVYFVLVPVY